MKKLIYCIFASAIILLAGCSKEHPTGGDIVAVSFNVSLEDIITKAAVDGDGAADNVNRFVIEVYAGGGGLFTRDVIKVASGDRSAQYTLELVAGQTYDFLFWADCSNDGEDLYYRTSSERGLRAVEMIGSYSGNNDARDAFCASRTLHVGADIVESIVLRRPFAQLNIITTDLDKILQEDLMPEEVKIKFKAKTAFDVFTGDSIGEDVVLSYSTIPYYQSVKSPALSEIRSEAGEWTLSMDYLFAPAQESQIVKVILDIKACGNPLPSKEITNVPFKRNYRTNVYGDLMTIDGSYTVSISPDWTGTL